MSSPSLSWPWLVFESQKWETDWERMKSDHLCSVSIYDKCCGLIIPLLHWIWVAMSLGESVSMRSHRSRGRGNVPYVRAITVIALLLPLISLAKSMWPNCSHWHFWRSLPERPLEKDCTFFKMSTKKWWFLFWPLLWLCDDAGFGAATPISYPWVHQPCDKADLMRVAAGEKNGKALESWCPH